MRGMHQLVHVCLLFLLGSISSIQSATAAATTERKSTEAKHIMLVSLHLRGHITPLARLARELVSRGYLVTFATPDAGYVLAETVLHASGAQIELLGTDPPGQVQRLNHLETAEASRQTPPWGLADLIDAVYLPYYLTMFDPVRELAERLQPDFLVVDVATLAGIDVAQLLGIPYIVNSPTLLFHGDDAPYYLPALGSGFSLEMSSWQRIFSFFLPRYIALSLSSVFTDLNLIRHDHGLKPHTTFNEILGQTILLVNTAFGFEYPRPLSPFVRMTGPLMPPEETSYDYKTEENPMPRKLLKFLDSRSNSSSSSIRPVVAVMLGEHSMAPIAPGCIRKLSEALAVRLRPENSTDYRILWALRRRHHDLLPFEEAEDGTPTATVCVQPDFSQVEVFQHPAVRVVVSPCGLPTVQEALYFGKAILCLPVIGDQHDVAARVESSGTGISVPNCKDTPPSVLRSCIEDLVTNRDYRRNSLKIAVSLRERGGTPKAADIVESTLRTGILNLEDVPAHMPWHLRTSLDILCVIVASQCLILLIIKFCFKSLSFTFKQFVPGFNGKHHHGYNETSSHSESKIGNEIDLNARTKLQVDHGEYSSVRANEEDGLCKRRRRNGMK